MTTSYRARHDPDPQVADAAALIGDPGRARMLFALLGGVPLAASELTARAGVSPSTASAHLAKLVAGGLITANRSGRQRFYALANADVGHALEALTRVAKPARIVALRQNIVAGELALARSCYDHLAGRLGVRIAEALVARGVLELDGAASFVTTHRAQVFFDALEIDMAAARAKSRLFAPQCIDWSERRPHLAGALGAAVRDRFLANGWLARVTTSRALHITHTGRAALAKHFALRLNDKPE